MIKDVKFNGVAVNSSDYISNDGDLELAINLANERMSYSPVFEPHQIGKIPAGWAAKYVHNNNIYRHIIVFNLTTNKIGWLDFPTNVDTKLYTEADIQILNTPEGYDVFVINSIVGVGNTLVVLTDKGILYFLWDIEAYISLGDHIPECEMQFSLLLDSSHLGLYTNHTISGIKEHAEHIQQIGKVTLTEAGGGGTYATEIILDKDKKTENNDAVLGGVNLVMAECKKKGYFLNNFFVRYAFRLYDGSLTMHSCPVLMVCSSDMMNPIVVSQRLRGSDNFTVGNFEVYAPKFKLRYKSLMNIDELEKWSDIIKSVDIFITPEITNYNADGDITVDDYHLDKTNGNFVLGITSGYPERTFFVASKDSSSEIAKTYYKDMLKEVYPGTDYLKIFKIPAFSDTYLLNKYKSNADFHLLYSCELKKLQSAFTSVPIEDEYLTTLSQRELMTDDNYSHDKLIAKTAFAYNSRINVANIRRIPFDGYNLMTIGPCCDKAYKREGYVIYYYICENGREVVVSKSIAYGELKYLPPFIYYPNPFVYKCIIHLTASNKFYELPMQQHDTLNGAYYFDGFCHGNVYDTGILGVGVIDEPPVEFPDYCMQVDSGPTDAELSTEKLIEYPNKIYTAYANNPFVFSAENINSVGASEILALSTITKALSQGQFGQFPLYAFTSEGVWALELSATGSITSMHPVTRDVCVNTSSITQVDCAVLFVTARGIMLLTGSDSICISDNINSNYPFDVSDLKGIDKLNRPKILELLDSAHSFDDFIKNCNLLYDYAHQRVIVYLTTNSEANNVAFVYSFKTKTWSMMETRIALSLNCYPDAICIDASNNILNYSTVNKNQKVLTPQVIVTRPLKLDAPDILKTVDTVIQRGNFSKGHVQSVIYGSRDLQNWHLVCSSKDHYLRGFRGTPYKYFRIVSLCDLAPGESVYGASLQFTPRLTDRLR